MSRLPLSLRRPPVSRLRHIAVLSLLTLMAGSSSLAAMDAAGGAPVGTVRTTARWTAARLLDRFERRLETATGPGAVAALVQEGERLQAAGLPRLRLSERSSWDFGELVDLGFGASLSWSLSDPVRTAQEELLAQRLELARHNARSQRASQLEEFRRTLRLLAHLEQVEALLTRHRSRLLALRPAWRELEQNLLGPSEAPSGSWSVAGGGGGPGAERVGFLEVVQALERTRRERSLLLLAVANRAGLNVQDLEGMTLGTPPLPDPAKVAQSCLAPGSAENAETVRAALVLDESRLAARADAARTLPKISLDLSGNARYSNTPLSRNPWNADLRLALRVSLSARTGVGAEISAAVTPAGLSQELSIGWPSEAAAGGGGSAVAEQGYRKALNDARFGALSKVKALHDARDNLRLRRAELTSTRRAALTRVADPGLLNETAQAELALLNAQLKTDLALLGAAAGCD